jgi:hypothetical protein
VESGQKRDGDEDDNGLLSVTNLDLSSTFVQVDPSLANPYLPSRRRVDWVCRLLVFWGDNYLLSRGELEGAEGGLEVSNGGLKVKESLSNAALQLGGSGVGGRVVSDLDGGHCVGCRLSSVRPFCECVDFR